MKTEPISLQSIPQYSMFSTEYRKAAKELVERGFNHEMPDGKYIATETTIA